MLPTLSALCDSLLSELAVIAPSPAPAIEIQAVHVSELLEPARYLDGGELLITSGMNIASMAEACATYTRQLADAGIEALAFGTGVIHPDVPSLLTQEAAAAGLPLLEVLPGTAFLTITRKYWQLRAESDQRELVRTLSSHRTLVAAALGGDESAIVRRLAAGAGGWAAQFSPTGDLLHAWPSDRRDSAAELSREATLAVFELLSAGNVSGARRVWALSGHEPPPAPVRPVLLDVDFTDPDTFSELWLALRIAGYA